MADGQCYRILCEEVLRENRFDYEIIVAERDGPIYTAEELYFGPLQMRARSPAFYWARQRLLHHKQQTLTHFARARQAGHRRRRPRKSPGRPGGSLNC